MFLRICIARVIVRVSKVVDWTRWLSCAKTVLALAAWFVCVCVCTCVRVCVCVCKVLLCRGMGFHSFVVKTPLNYFTAVSSRYAPSHSSCLPSTLPDNCN